MKRHIKRAFALVLTLTLLVSTFSFQASAASGRISFSDPTVTVGDTVTISVSATSDAGIGSMDATLSYNTSLLEYISGSGDGAVSGGSGSVSLSYYSAQGPTRVSFSLKFKAKAAGTAVVNATYGEFATVDEETFTPGLGTSTVTINPPKQASSEARLSSLKVGSGSLSPAFSPDVYDYSVTVPAGTEKLRISLSTKDGNAKYSISGTKLSVGSNTITIAVTAEDGSSKTYTIHATRPADGEKPEEKPDEKPEENPEEKPEEQPVEDTRVSVTVDGAQLFVGENLENLTIPEGFELGTVQYGDREVPAAIGLSKPLTLLWLVDEANTTGAFYVLDAENNGFYPYVSLTAGQKIFSVMPLPEGAMPPAGYEESTVTIGEDVYACWKNTAKPDSEFVLIYAMNWDGQTGFYRYDTVEGTMQRVSGDDSMEDAQYNAETFAALENDTKEKLEANESALKQSKLLVLILIIVAAVELLLFITIFAITRRRGGAVIDDGYEGSRSEDSDDFDPSLYGEEFDAWDKDNE